MSVFTMPSLGADMEAGTLAEWLVGPGDCVRRGDIVAVVETQKGAIEIEIFEEGEVARLLAETGQTVKVGAPLAEIAGEAGDMAEHATVETAAATKPGPEARAPAPLARSGMPPTPTTPPAAASPRPTLPEQAGVTPPSSPAARVRAAELGVDLAVLPGSGPGGAILLADVEQAGSTPAPNAIREDAGRPRASDAGAMRAAIAAAMTRSKREIPHYYLAHEIDLARATDWLTATNADLPPEDRLVLGLLLVRAVARAVDAVPEMNGTFIDGAFKASAAVHAGVAISLRGGGLVAPALHDAGSRPLAELMSAMRDLVERARTGRLRSSEFSDPTITVSSLGDRGVDLVEAIIFPPQVALVGFGTPRPKPTVVGDAVVSRMSVTASISGDHRVSDGRAGAKFLARIDRLLQKPEEL